MAGRCIRRTIGRKAEVDGRGGTSASKACYESLDELVVEVAEGVDPAPVTLILGEAERLAGQVCGAQGQPLAGVRLMVMGPGAGEGRFHGEAESGPDGRFELPRPAVGALRLFAIGLECPLTWVEASGAAMEEEIAIDCEPAPTTLQLRMLGPEGEPRRGEFVRLRRGDVLVPDGLVRGYLLALGLPVESTGDGRIVLPSLAPGRYDLFLERSSSAESVVMGLDNGFATSVELGGFETTELEISIDARSR